MFGKRKADVLVVGAGPVGLMTALVLAKRGVPVEIIDREWRTGAHSYALALHAQSLRLLGELGLRDEILSQAYRIDRVAFYDGTERKAEIRLTPDGQCGSALAVLRQDVLEQSLENALEHLGGKVHWNHELSHAEPQKDNVAATIDTLEKDSMGYAVAHTEWVVTNTTEVSVPLVVGADGHQSLVRRTLGADYSPIGDPQHFAVFEFRSDADLDHEMRIILADATTSILWPLPEGYCRWSFQLENFAAPESTRVKHRGAVQLGGAEFPMLSEERLRTLIAQRAPWFTGSIEEINWQIAVRFERRLASAMGRGRMWLAGDAAHVTGPAGTQSMNVGFREAHELAGIMAGILQNGEAIGRLETYNIHWQSEWRRLLGLNGGLQPTDTTDPWIANRADRLLPSLPASADDLVAMATQLGLRLGRTKDEGRRTKD
jgi:2-polyprenyl-6-methoxyphenol hydroxylase-like FAD-dependent oxidoreductase